MKDWSKQTVVQLKAELKSRGLATTGLKQELVSRLSEDDAAGAAAENEAEPSESEPAENPDPQPVQLPESSTGSAAAPVDNTFKEVASTETEPANAPSESARSSPERSDKPAAPIHLDKQDVPTPVLKTEASVQSEPHVPTEIAQDAQKRKRRSESPVQSLEEVSRKRVKADEDKNTQSSEPFGVTGVISKIQGEPMEQNTQPQEAQGDAEDVEMTKSEKDSNEKAVERSHSGAPAPDDSRDVEVPSRNDDQAQVAQAHFNSVKQPSPAPVAGDATEIKRDVQPAVHPATRALYIKNFMRPLREDMVQAHLLELATIVGAEHNEDDIENLFVDRIKTHAFVIFRTTTQASRVRNALHDVIWPDERERKPLWVDFIPPEKVAEWIDDERNQGSGRGGTRWEIQYDREEDGFVVARLISGTAPPPAIPAPYPARQIPSGPAVKDVNSTPLGSRAERNIDGTPLGPRGDPPRGPSGRPPRQIPDFPGGPIQTTRQKPTISFQPVSDDLADRRMRNMLSYFTQDLKRDMGPETDINRYTFEQGDSFVDRGHENFVGIRPPHREREVQRRRDRGGGGGGPRGPPPPRGRRNGNRRAPRPLSDRYLPGINESGPYRQGDRGNFVPRGDDRDRRY